jgi:quinoprotein glucose dehydrogenase
VTVNHDGKNIDVVAMATKAGFLWVFDRVSGRPVWPIEERPVPKSDVPGEEAYPTQPFPTTPPPFARQQFSVEDLNPFYLTAEERQALKVKIAKARNDGMFTPPSLNRDTIQMPGLRGGNNWGATAAHPARGMVYLLTQDWPTISHLTTEDPYGPSAASVRSRAAGQPGRAAYEESCQACHGVNGAGSAMAPMPLSRIDGRMARQEFTQVITGGRGEMGAITNVDAKTIDAVYAFLSDPTAARTAGTAGPVVASGGAPGGLEPQPLTAHYTQMSGPPYPDGVDAPQVRYYTGYGMEYSHIINPPWSSIVAYDLNKGTIKWKVPHGEDAQAMAEGGKNTGVFRGGERHGMIVTSAGLIFTASLDGKARAYDAETGRVLWTATLPAGSEGVPAMYEANGKQYFLVSASSPITSGRRMPGASDAEPLPGRGYVAFALPDARKTSR